MKTNFEFNILYFCYLIPLSKDLKDEDYSPKILTASKRLLKLEPPRYWAERVIPIEGESLSSWMIRTALANLTTLASLLKEIHLLSSEKVRRKKKSMKFYNY